jgi:hypothetical protein
VGHTQDAAGTREGQEKGDRRVRRKAPMIGVKKQE